MLVQLASRDPDIAFYATMDMDVELPEPPAGSHWVHNGFVVWDWVRVREGDWFCLDTRGLIKPEWSAHRYNKANPVSGGRASGVDDLSRRAGPSAGALSLH